jgi:hypothetical protein
VNTSMMMSARWARLRGVLAGALALSLTACGAAPHGIVRAPTTVGAPVAIAAPSFAPMRLELEVVAARGDLAVLTDKADWQPAIAGARIAGARELRAGRRGAIIALGRGDAAGRLWLRAGARVRLGQDATGVQVAMIAGQARLRRTPAALPVAIDGVAIVGDLLLDARPDGRTDRTRVGARPELATWAIALEQAETGAGVGRLDAEAGAKTEPLALARVAVRVRIDGDVATTEVEHVFHNPADGRPREGTFRFPVPDGAMLVGMAMEIDGKLMEGEIVERDKAREVYESIVDKMEDPALLEWEQGNWFKLRVFPIEAGQDKRVVIRYAQPLTRGAAGYAYDYALAIDDAQARAGAVAPIGEFSLVVDGREVAHETNLVGGLDLSVPVAPDKVPAAMTEARADGAYTAIRIHPDARMFQTPIAKGPRQVAVVIDTSRSALEGKALAQTLARATLAELGPGDQFAVLGADVTVVPATTGFVPVTPAAIDAALARIDAIEPDGASDLGLALAGAAALHPTEVVYVGDGIPTWGELAPAKLAAAADAIHAPISAALIGKGASSTLWADLAGRTGGRAEVVRRADDATRFALAIADAPQVPRVVDATVQIGGAAAVFPTEATTVWAGDELVALARTDAGAPPTEATLSAIVDGKPVHQTIKIAAVPEANVARRWAREEIAAQEEAGGDKDAIVKLSQDFGVLSRYTSLLVLENDEAYKAHQIERKQEQLAAATPTVTGGDLDSLGARQASLSPDEIQPGDPEIKIPAPRDARSVVVTFPFGETKLAEWDDDVDAWMVRFLIDNQTPDGEYQARVTITHADGRVETTTLSYTVDTRAPAVQLTATRIPGGYKLVARQVADGTSHRKDADRVEVMLPDGTSLMLDQLGPGKFTGIWWTAPVHGLSLRVVVRDNALNQAAQALVIE